MKVVVYERTSGAEDEGQDVKAQLAQTVHRAREADLEVIGEYCDEDVPGDTPWNKRQGLTRALARLREAADPGNPPRLLVREISRLWRGDVAEGIIAIRSVPELLVLGAPHWERQAGRWVQDTMEAEMMRLVGLLFSWAEKRGAVERSALAMRDILEGRRATKSGKPPGRPMVNIDPKHVEAVRGTHAEHGLARAHKQLLDLRGYYEASDPRTQKKRYVGRETLARALGLRGTATQNPLAPKTPPGKAALASTGRGPVVGGGSRPRSAGKADQGP